MEGLCFGICFAWLIFFFIDVGYCLPSNSPVFPRIRIRSGSDDPTAARWPRRKLRKPVPKNPRRSRRRLRSLSQASTKRYACVSVPVAAESGPQLCEGKESGFAKVFSVAESATMGLGLVRYYFLWLARRSYVFFQLEVYVAVLFFTCRWNGYAKTREVRRTGWKSLKPCRRSTPAK